jgi:hypothetical protein
MSLVLIFVKGWVNPRFYCDLKDHLPHQVSNLQLNVIMYANLSWKGIFLKLVAEVLPFCKRVGFFSTYHLCYSTGVEWQEREANHSPYVAVIKNVWSYTFTPIHVIMTCLFRSNNYFRVYFRLSLNTEYWEYMTALTILDRNAASHRFEVCAFTESSWQWPIHYTNIDCCPLAKVLHFKKSLRYVRFEVFAAVTMKNGVFWDVMPCDSCKNRKRLHQYCS